MSQDSPATARDVKRGRRRPRTLGMSVADCFHSGGSVARRSSILVAATLLIAFAQPASAQQPALARVVEPDSAQAQIRAVLRAFYLNFATQNWDALSAYVLSPKLLERRGSPGDLEMAAKGRTRGRGSTQAAAAPRRCPASTSPMIDDAVIRLDQDWAEVSVPRCSGATPGVDEFRLLYFEERWRFIYTDLFQGSPAPETAERPNASGRQEQGR
jgi:hypothetical protein